MFVSRFATAAILSLGLTPVAWAQQSTPVQVINLQSYSYTPSPIRLQAGRPVTLQFVNRAGKGHDFTAPKFFRSARILSGHVEDGEVDLGPGRSASITLIPVAGRYKVHCGHLFHKTLGMRSEIIVQ